MSAGETVKRSGGTNGDNSLSTSRVWWVRGEQTNPTSLGLGFLSWVTRTYDGRAENSPTIAYREFNFLQGTEEMGTPSFSRRRGGPETTSAQPRAQHQPRSLYWVCKTHRILVRGKGLKYNNIINIININ